MNGEEFHFTSLCDGNIGHDNKLNDFEAPLPHPVNCGEHYSMALDRVTFPYMMHNINRYENMMTFSLFQRFYKDEETDVVDWVNNVKSRLL